MIDAVQWTYNTTNSKTHLLSVPWEVLTYEQTGNRVNDERTTNLRGINFRLKPSQNVGYNLLANGSLHKWHNCGEHNADQFTFEKLMLSIDSITDILEIPADKCVIHGLEVGVNIELPHSPQKVLKNVVCYKSKPFTQINKRAENKGLQCALSQYRVKAYDKKKQSGIDCGNLLRFEIAIDRMAVLKGYEITTLADLQDKEKVYKLVNVLSETYAGIVWTDSTVNLHRLSNREQKQWLFFSNPKQWAQMGKHKRYRAGIKWDALLKKNGNTPDILQLILNNWKSLFYSNNEAEKQRPFYQPEIKNKALETATFLPFICTEKKSHTHIPKTTIQKHSFDIVENNNTRKCLTCKKDISTQRKGSVFCSEILYGKQAKKCRNKYTNNHRRIKQKIKKAMTENYQLAVTYADEKGNIYTDILYPSEINITKNWLNKVLKISLLPLETTQKETQ